MFHVTDRGGGRGRGGYAQQGNRGGMVGRRDSHNHRGDYNGGYGGGRGGGRPNYRHDADHHHHHHQVGLNVYFLYFSSVT